MANRKQTFETRPGYGPKWSETEVRTFESWDDSKVASKTLVRTTSDAKFVDLHLEEYTGETRRAKLCTVRLEEEAGRALFVQLQALYAK